MSGRVMAAQARGAGSDGVAKGWTAVVVQMDVSFSPGFAPVCKVGTRALTRIAASPHLSAKGLCFVLPTKGTRSPLAAFTKTAPIPGVSATAHSTLPSGGRSWDAFGSAKRRNVRHVRTVRKFFPIRQRFSVFLVVPGFGPQSESVPRDAVLRSQRTV